MAEEIAGYVGESGLFTVLYRLHNHCLDEEIA